MKISAQQKRTAIRLLNSNLAAQGYTMKSFCDKHQINYQKTYHKFRINKFVDIDELNAFLKKVNPSVKLVATETTVILSRK